MVKDSSCCPPLQARVRVKDVEKERDDIRTTLSRRVRELEAKLKMVSRVWNTHKYERYDISA